MHRTLSLLFTATIVCAALAGQSPRPLSHEDYDQWKSIRSTTWSDDGEWVAYSVVPQWGDGVLEVRHTGGGVSYQHERGSSPVFSNNGKQLFFTIEESEIEERTKRLEELAEKGKVGKKKSNRGSRGFGGSWMRGIGTRRPGSTPRRSGGKGDLGILDFDTGEVEIIENVKGFRAPSEISVLIYHVDEEDEDDKKDKSEGAEEETEKKAEPEPEPTAKPEPEPEKKEKGEDKKDKKDKKKNKRKDGTTLVVRDLGNGNETRYDHVVGYGLTEESTWLYFHTSTKEDVEGVDHGLFAVRLTDGELFELAAGVAEYTGFASDDGETGLAFASNLADIEAEEPRYDLYLWDMTASAAQMIAGPETKGMPADKVVAKSGISFSDDGTVLSFGIQNPPEELPKILPEEKVVLDLWHYRDGLLQTMQEKQKSSLDNPSWSCVYHRDGGRVVVLGDEAVPTMTLLTPDGSRAIAADSKPYDQRISWDGRYQDVWLVNTVDGARTKVIEELRGSVSPSPTGRYLAYFSDGHWHSLDVETREKRNLTDDLPVFFYREDDDHPAPKPSWGSAGWTEGDQAIVLYDEFDLWRIHPDTGDAACVTDGMGRAERMQLRVVRLDRERDYLPEDLTLTARQLDTMAEGIYTDALHDLAKPVRLVWRDQHIGGLAKPRNADRFGFTLETYATYPDIWTAQTDFSDMRKLSDANPQQAEYSWGQAELVHWVSTDGKPMKGILVKPDGFDPKKKYPMMVYFYEKMSSRLHRYTTPSPGTSPNAAYYVSNGYLWFMPDIVYDVGYPGDSCLKCVVPGVQSLIAQGFVDEDSIGAAGHSWGGYQTAYLVTRTDIFKAVESGAPVSNMISAYGGIRWASGMSRQFQYERTQSRIGGSPWQYPMRYWENSPIFFADKVETPVLMLHNDEDGAVPWYQGIEYFVALRRLGKEAYMFNYVGEAHGLRQRQNQEDWTRRMQEYFDHHLRGQQAPKWMTEGVPFVERELEKLPFVRSLREAADEATPAAPAKNGETHKAAPKRRSA